MTASRIVSRIPMTNAWRFKLRQWPDIQGFQNRWIGIQTTMLVISAPIYHIATIVKVAMCTCLKAFVAKIRRQKQRIETLTAATAI